MAYGYSQIHYHSSGSYLYFWRCGTEMDNLLWRGSCRGLYIGLGFVSRQRSKERRMNMGALIMFGLVIVIANIGGIYFMMQDKKHQTSK